MTEVINIERLSKVYRRGIKRNGRTTTEDFWALRNLSFSINQGDVLGVIGKNGAGKSTLLKILSKITSPTSGKITMKGRVSSLLEVGTGFHPEMTGRENIYMNGNILGMSNSEVTRKLDQIVEFSGVREFLETPVKRYSSGMQTRLAFAVAAHLEPEILIIDEVLAVGDAEFQRKCLGKMDEIGNSGRTVLFVSHNMSAIKNLCNRCIWLKNGELSLDCKDTDEVVRQYIRETVPSNETTEWDAGNRIESSDKFVEFKSFRLVNDKGDLLDPNLNGDDKVYVAIEFTINELHPDIQIGFVLYDASLNMIFLSYHTDNISNPSLKFNIGHNTLKCTLPVEILNDGTYSLQLIAGVHNSHPILSKMDSRITISFNILGNSQRSNVWIYKRSTMIAPILEWKANE